MRAARRAAALRSSARSHVRRYTSRRRLAALHRIGRVPRGTGNGVRAVGACAAAATRAVVAHIKGGLNHGQVVLLGPALAALKVLGPAVRVGRALALACRRGRGGVCGGVWVCGVGWGWS